MGPSSELRIKPWTSKLHTTKDMVVVYFKPSICLRKSQRNSFRTMSKTAEVRTLFHLNTDLENYHETNLHALNKGFMDTTVHWLEYHPVSRGSENRVISSTVQESRDTHLSHPVIWQLVSLPFSGLNCPLVLRRSGCKMYKSTRLSHGRGIVLLFASGDVGMLGGSCCFICVSEVLPPFSVRVSSRVEYWSKLLVS
jgi:hypothetical protein